MGANSGSREPNPQAVSALSGFDPGRVEEALKGVRRALVEGNHSLALGYTEIAVKELRRAA